MLDPATALAFSLFENKGVYALLLGSGLSRAAQIPTGWEITLDLIRRVAGLQGVVDEPDWAAWYRNDTGKEPNYSDVLDSVSTLPDERRSILHSYIEPTPDDIREGRKVPTRAHHAIASLVRDGFIRVILTTNFDRLMENALRDAGVEPTVVRSDDDLRGAVPLIHSRCYLLKLHGDYLDTRIKNTEDELSIYSPAMDSLLDRILDDHGLITCGWSGEWDHALRNAIARAPNRRFPTFWAARGPIQARGEDLIRQRAAKVIPIVDADTFFTDLQQKAATQSEMQRPNPRSTDLTVATVKRQISRPESRIQLNDLLAEESRKLASRIDAGAFPTQGAGTQEEYILRVRRYEAETDCLARIFGILGRWGGEAEILLASEILGDVARVKIESGLVVWLGLKFYPTVLLFYAYGLGALRAGNCDLLFRWFKQLVQGDNRETQPLVVRFVNWLADTHGQWNMLAMQARAKTPLSDHLHSISTAWASDYILAERDHTRHFEMFEILIALAFLTLGAKISDFQEAHSNAPGDRNFVWSPVGRASWDGETRRLIMSDLERPEMRAALLGAGFGGKDESHLTLAIDSVRRQMSRLAW